MEEVVKGVTENDLGYMWANLYNGCYSTFKKDFKKLAEQCAKAVLEEFINDHHPENSLDPMVVLKSELDSNIYELEEEDFDGSCDEEDEEYPSTETVECNEPIVLYDLVNFNSDYQKIEVFREKYFYNIVYTNTSTTKKSQILKPISEGYPYTLKGLEDLYKDNVKIYNNSSSGNCVYSTTTNSYNTSYDCVRREADGTYRILYTSSDGTSIIDIRGDTREQVENLFNSWIKVAIDYHKDAAPCMPKDMYTDSPAETSKSPKYKVGDKVKIVGNEEDGEEYHSIKLGSIGLIKSVTPDGESFEYCISGVSVDTGDNIKQYLYEHDITSPEKPESPKEENVPRETKYKVGDKFYVLEDGSIQERIIKEVRKTFLGVYYYTGKGTYSDSDHKDMETDRQKLVHRLMEEYLKQLENG